MSKLKPTYVPWEGHQSALYVFKDGSAPTDQHGHIMADALNAFQSTNQTTSQLATSQLAHQVKVLMQENEDLRDTVKFVERWAVHHGTKACYTPESILSAIQHYPGIKKITASYADGECPQTADPYARIAELEQELIKEATRTAYYKQRYLQIERQHSKLHGDIMNIQCAPRGVEHGFISHDYKAGHRDARHAAAELAARASTPQAS